MFTISMLTVNPFRENTYVLHSDNGKAVVIDPGMSNAAEEKEFYELVAQARLIPEKTLLTHCHIDHVLGVRSLNIKFKLEPWYHAEEAANYVAAMEYGPGIGLPISKMVPAGGFLNEGDVVEVNGCQLEVLATPGHSAGSVCFYCREQGFLIGGDVLFRESVGRTDLPGGNFDQLKASINRLMRDLPPETVVFPGHGPQTTLAHEARNNPYL